MGFSRIFISFLGFSMMSPSGGDAGRETVDGAGLWKSPGDGLWGWASMKLVKGVVVKLSTMGN